MKRLRLFRSEWTKAVTTEAYQRFLLIWCTCGLASLLVIGIFSRVSPDSLPSSPQDYLPLNQVLQRSVDILYHVGKFAGMAFMAHLLGREYAQATWKMLLPRHGNRADFLLAKLMTWATGVLAFAAATFLTAVVGGWVACQIAAVDFWDLRPTMEDLPVGPQEFQGIMLTLMLLNTLYLGALSFTASILSRSTVGGVLTGFGAPAVLVGISQLSSSWARGVPGTHIENLLRTWVALPVPFAEPLFDVPVSATQSVLVVVGFSVVALSVGFAVFTRRDIAGQ